MTAYGQIPHRSFIDSISLASMCEIVTTASHGYNTNDFVRLSNLGGCMPPPIHGATQLDGYKYRIIVTGVDRFYIQDPITFEYIDSTSFTPYTDGGYCNLIEQNFYYYGDDPNG